MFFTKQIERKKRKEADTKYKQRKVDEKTIQETQANLAELLKQELNLSDDEKIRMGGFLGRERFQDTFEDVKSFLCELISSARYMTAIMLINFLFKDEEQAPMQGDMSISLLCIEARAKVFLANYAITKYFDYIAVVDESTQENIARVLVAANEQYQALAKKTYLYQGEYQTYYLQAILGQLHVRALAKRNAFINYYYRRMMRTSLTVQDMMLEEDVKESPVDYRERDDSFSDIGFSSCSDPIPSIGHSYCIDDNPFMRETESIAEALAQMKQSIIELNNPTLWTEYYLIEAMNHFYKDNESVVHDMLPTIFEYEEKAGGIGLGVLKTLMVDETNFEDTWECACLPCFGC